MSIQQRRGPYADDARNKFFQEGSKKIHLLLTSMHSNLATVKLTLAVGSAIGLKKPDILSLTLASYR